MPIPPAAAMAIAMRASVTVSIAAESRGMLMWMLRESRVTVSTVFGRTSLSPGTSRTSSKVRASRRSSRLSMRTYIHPSRGGQDTPPSPLRDLLARRRQASGAPALQPPDPEHQQHDRERDEDVVSEPRRLARRALDVVAEPEPETHPERRGDERSQS